MADNKTRANGASVRAYLDAIPDAGRRADCEALSALMERVTGAPPVIWGDSIVGFDSYHYTYDSGREGDACLYLSCGTPELQALLARLGRHKMGKACLYLRRLEDVDQQVLEQLVAESAAATRARYPA